MTRASMAEVMTSQYIRTADILGILFNVIMKHALAQRADRAVHGVVLQMNWLLSGVVVVEVFFEYDGFGKLLLEGGPIRRRVRGPGVYAGGGDRRR